LFSHRDTPVNPVDIHETDTYVNYLDWLTENYFGTMSKEYRQRCQFDGNELHFSEIQARFLKYTN